MSRRVLGKAFRVVLVLSALATSCGQFQLTQNAAFCLARVPHLGPSTCVELVLTPFRADVYPCLL